MSKSHRKRSQPQPKTPTTASGPKWFPRIALPDLIIGLALILAIFVVYSQVGRFDFTTYDDDLYVYENVHVTAGLTLDSIEWALTAVVSNHWIPVTLLSHILAAQLFHMDSGMHHWVNVWLHALSAVLLFMVFRRATGARWPSAFVAFVFGLHPLHVSSVAWVSERKDVLSAVFFFLALYFYLRYAERPSAGRYLTVAGIFCLGLMSKPMLVTFPFVLLLFDFWPLHRVQWPRILWEKLPLVALSVADSAVTYFGHRSGGAVQSTFSLSTRIGNSLVSCVTYIGQMIWPVRLAVFYPYPKSIPAWQVLAALAVILGISAVAVFAWRTRPYLAVGWFWYLGMLIPVIGLVQVGVQSRADRYTYLPMIGLSIMLAWGAAELVQKLPLTKPAIAAAAVVSCTLWMAVAWINTGYWRNSETLYRHAIDVTEDNWVAQYNLGHYLMITPGRTADAIPHFETTLRLNPDYAEADNNLGSCLMNLGRNADAIVHFEEALRYKPDFADVHFNLGMAFSNLHRDSEAMAQYEAALRLRPDFEMAHTNLGMLLVRQHRNSDAIPHFEAAVRLNSDYRNEHNLGAILLTLPGRQAEALKYLEAAQSQHPDPDVAKIISNLRAAPRKPAE